MSIRQRLSSEYADILAGVDLFAGLDRVTLAKLAAHLEPVAVNAGTPVFGQGDPGDAFYLVVRGSLGVYVTDPSGFGDNRVNTLGPGAPFGEMALLTGQPRSATVRADREAEVLRLERTRFLGLVRREPQVALAIAGTLCQRLRRADARHLETTDIGGDAAPAAESTAVTAAEAPVAMPRQSRRRPSGATLGALLAGIILLVTWITPPPAGLTPAGWRALGTLVAAVPVLALEGLPEGVLALTLTAVWVVGKWLRSVALSGFASASWVLLVSVLIVGAAIASSGLLYRLALWIVAHTLALYHGTGGRMFTRRQARLAAIAYGVVTLLALCAAVPAWRAMGLL